MFIVSDLTPWALLGSSHWLTTSVLASTCTAALLHVLLCSRLSFCAVSLLVLGEPQVVSLCLSRRRMIGHESGKVL